MIPAGLVGRRRERIIMLLLGVALPALIAGTILRKVGVEAARANTYGSAAALAGRRKSGLGNWLNLAGTACLVAAVLWTWL